eukprot:3349249-Rhodomonas_salina.2
MESRAGWAPARGAKLVGSWLAGWRGGDGFEGRSEEPAAVAAWGGWRRGIPFRRLGTTPSGRRDRLVWCGLCS